jgi:hypothetical protein
VCVRVRHCSDFSTAKAFDVSFTGTGAGSLRWDGHDRAGPRHPRRPARTHKPCQGRGRGGFAVSHDPSVGSCKASSTVL